MKPFRSHINETHILKPGILVYGSLDDNAVSALNEAVSAKQCPLFKSEKDTILDLAKEAFDSGVDHLFIANHIGINQNQFKIINEFNNLDDTYSFKKFTLISFDEKVVSEAETLREQYKDQKLFNLREMAKDLCTGLTGKIVYRGPTYVTLQITEDFSFKRWIHEVESLKEEGAPSIVAFSQFSSRDTMTGVQLTKLNHELINNSVRHMDPLLIQDNASTVRKLKNFRKLED